MKTRHNVNKTGPVTLVLFSVLILIGVGLIALISYVKSSNGTELQSSFDWQIDKRADEEVYAYAYSGAPWESEERTGNKYDVQLVNGSNKNLKDWKVYIPVPRGCRIANTWNGSWTIRDNNLIYTPSDYNKIVPAGKESIFGVIVYSEETIDVSQISLVYKLERPLSDYLFFWILIAAALMIIVAVAVMHVVEYKLRKYAETHAAYKDLVSESLNTIANIIDTKDEYTKGHSVRVAIYSRMIAKHMGMSAYDQERIYYIGLLHDIGKVGIPVSILTKPGRLSEEEFEIIKRHPAMGSSIMKDFTSIPGVQNGIRYHHERYDGNGYNEGLKGDEIPLEGRLICVADSYDAMSSKRCYRNALSYEFILDELKRNSGTQFDPEILKHLIALIEEGSAPISDAELLDYYI